MGDVSDRVAAMGLPERVLLENSMRARAAATESVPRRPQSGRLPLSFAQQRLWFLDHFEPGSSFYNIPVPVRLRGQLDVAALSRALDEVVRRHEVLRTTFPAPDGQPEQRVGTSTAVPLPVVDLRDTPQPLREAEARRFYGEETRRPFDLSAGPLLRAALVRIDDLDSLAVFTFHHIVFDGWSTPIFKRELETLLEAFTAGRPSPLPEPPLQYGDFAVWQRGMLTGPTLEGLLGYWREALGGAPPELELPADRPRPLTTRFAGASRAFDVPAAVSGGLRRLFKEEGATPFMGLLAAFQVLLHRYSGQDDVVVGTTVAGRGRSELEPLVGFFANAVVLRSDLSGRPTFRALLRDVRETCLGAYAHQELPFERLVEELRPERHLSRNPLFQVMFVLQNVPGAPGGRVAGDGRAAHASAGSADARHVSGTAKFDLTLAMAESGERLRGAVEYNTDLFDAATIDRMVEHFGILLDGISGDPDRCVEDLPLLAPAERRARERWSGLLDAAPAPLRSLPQIAAAAALRTPGATAVEAPDRAVSYAELVAGAGRLAQYLRARGVGTDDVVATCLERSVDVALATVGILQAGAAILPLDPSHPPARLAYMVQRSGARLVLAHEALGVALPAGVPVVHLDGAAREDIAACRPAAAGAVHPDQLAWVVFTSGSTGRPKGVLVPHRGVGPLAGSMRTTFEAAARDRVLQFASLSFDASLFEMLLAFEVGATLVVEPQDGLLPGGDLARLLERRGVSLAVLSPSALSSMPADGLGRLRSVVFAGDAFGPELVARWGRGRRVHNAYGPTETTIAATLARRSESGALPLGRPVAGTQVHVLDRHLSALPPGCAGELYVGGAGVARGYAAQPDATAERYVPDPFSDVAGARMYRTGDRARLSADGDLEFLGRADDQVKLRGFRIEPREVAACLTEHPSVRDAVVTVRRDASGAAGLVAYAVSPRPVADDELRAFLRERLPEYMLPAAFVVLPRLPLSRSGKVDRAALPAPDRLRAERTDVVAPRTPLEEQIAGIWRDVLRLEQVGVTDSFFDLGGHSLLATQVLARASEALRVELSLRSLFLDPTVAGLALAVERARSSGTGPGAPPIVPRPREGPLPLSFAQERLWFLDRLEPGSAFYNIPAALRLSGRVDVTALAGALAAVVARHEVLRTRFAVHEGAPVQVIEAPGDVALARHDLSALAPAERERAALRLAGEEARAPFDLEAGPLLRASLVTLSERDHLLLLTLHHIVADGWSVGVLVDELDAAYAARAGGSAHEPAPLPVQYADYAIWQRQWLSGEVLAGLVAWWRAELRGAPPLLELPADRPRPAVQLHRGASFEFTLTDSLTQELRTLARREGVTMFMLLLSAFAVLLHRYTGETDIVTGTPVAGRRPEVESLAGLFVNTLALRCDASGRPSFRTLLGRVRETTLSAFAHQDLPFEQLVEGLHPERDLSHNPVFQVMFAWQNLPGLAAGTTDAQPEPAPREQRPRAAGSGTAKFDLTLFMAESAPGLRAGFEYDTDLFDGERIEGMAAHLTTLLGAITRDPEQAVDALPLLDGAAEQEALLSGPAPEADADAGGCIHELVEAQVRRTPDAVAVEFEDAELTYAELDRRAGALAGELQRRGVAPEAVVGVAVERSLDMVVALLGVLKAGAAYLPLDAGHPDSRLAHQLRASAVEVVLTSADERARLRLPAGVEALAVDRLDPASAPAAAPAGARAANLAYVIYTSGSTGEPKGVMNAHGPVRNRLRWMLDTQPIGAADAVVQKTPITFDVSAWEIFWPLCSGARLVVARPGGHRDAQYLVDLVARRGVTVVHFVPSMLPAFLAQPDVGRCDRLRRVYCSGEALGHDLQEHVFEVLPSVQLHNLYGPTEAAIEVTSWVCRRDPEAHSVPIGRPLPGARLYVLDRGLRPVPLGVPGELYLGGLPVARGYQQRPDLTADRFVPDPFGRPGERMYRTGDRACVRAGGAVEYLGRLDSQVKLRGLRVELGEIEWQLRAHPRVAGAVVALCHVGEHDQRLVAYVVPSGGRDPAAAEAIADDLRAHLRSRLPEYMVPTAFVPLDEIPLGRSGKVDRAALPAPGQPVRPRRRPPSTPVERRVAAIWAEVLHTHTLDLADRFFEIGGNSLLATQVTARVNQALDVDVPLRLLFEASALGEYAAAVATSSARAPGERDDLAGPITRRDPAYLLEHIDELGDDEVAALLAELDDGTEQ